MSSNETVVASTDWIGRPNVFYTRERFSTNFNDLVEDEFEWDATGLHYFLDWGFCVFERTPVSGIRLMPPNADLVRRADSTLVVRPRPEPDWLKIIHTPTHPDDVFGLIETTIRTWESSVQGEIILPLSGGYDSRLIAAMIGDRSRVRAFTYGGSFVQSRSKEAVIAQEAARRLGLSWKQIILGDYHRYLDQWHALFGAATHAHGMYHIEFYLKIAENIRGPLISGLVGDPWAGKTFAPVLRPEELNHLKLTHGMHADSRALRLKASRQPEVEYYEKHQTSLADERYCVLAAVRLKMTLLQYLEVVPRSLGFEPFSPLCTQETAAAMLALPQELRKKRIWQTRYFLERNLLPEKDGLRYDRRNDLARTAWNRIVPPPLDEHALGQILHPEYVRRINRAIARPPRRWRYHFFQDAVRAAARFGIPFANPYNTAYFAYLTLHPLDRLARRRSARFLSL
ncbi:MAG: asparagine synthase-related protein [Bacteroidia bacterium]|nr:asparagine synthase-related protein [Bacteroidia bacterium]MDW8332717.1 asparagine synthase-related protein [Bacteroidia bacterium]